MSAYYRNYANDAAEFNSSALLLPAAIVLATEDEAKLVYGANAVLISEVLMPSEEDLEDVIGAYVDLLHSVAVGLSGRVLVCVSKSQCRVLDELYWDKDVMRLVTHPSNEWFSREYARMRDGNVDWDDVYRRGVAKSLLEHYRTQCDNGEWLYIDGLRRVGEKAQGPAAVIVAQSGAGKTTEAVARCNSPLVMDVDALLLTHPTWPRIRQARKEGKVSLVDELTQGVLIEYEGWIAGRILLVPNERIAWWLVCRDLVAQGGMAGENGVPVLRVRLPSDVMCDRVLAMPPSLRRDLAVKDMCDASRRVVYDPRFSPSAYVSSYPSDSCLFYNSVAEAIESRRCYKGVDGWGARNVGGWLLHNRGY